MAPSDVASKIYSEAVVVGGINVSNRESTAVFDSLQVGGVTAIHATIAVWEGYVEAKSLGRWGLSFAQGVRGPRHRYFVWDPLRMTERCSFSLCSQR